MKIYGNLQNRLEENKNYTGREIKVGDDATTYSWSDRHAYFVTKVINQKHIFIKGYQVCADHSKEGGMGHQNWLYFKTLKEMNTYLNSCHLKMDGKEIQYPTENLKENGETELVYRYGHWYIKQEYWYGTKLEKPQYNKINISFGVKDNYYDWEF